MPIKTSSISIFKSPKFKRRLIVVRQFDEWIVVNTKWPVNAHVTARRAVCSRVFHLSLLHQDHGVRFVLKSYYM